MADQCYIGTPNGVVVCVDRLSAEGCDGRFYHAYRKEEITFRGLGEMLFRMEQFYDVINFPRRANNVRDFMEKERVYVSDKGIEKMVTDQELLKHRGSQETFIVRVQHRENNSWQGRITWVDKNKTLTFRSIWEVVHMMENALYEDASPEDIPQIRSWDD